VGVHVSGEAQIPAPPYTHTPGCPASNTGWIVAVAIVGAILLLGLLALIIIKLILLILDRTEYKKFTKQLQEADWAPHDNPLYVNPQQDYRNVAYKKR